MSISRRSAKIAAAGFAIAAAALFTPAVTSSANALPPCCTDDHVYT